MIAVTSANEGAKTTSIDCYRRRFYSEERREKRQDLLGERIHISAYNAGLGQSARDGYHHVPGAVFGYGSLYVVTDPFKEISLDWITGLSESTQNRSGQRFNAIL